MNHLLVQIVLKSPVKLNLMWSGLKYTFWKISFSHHFWRPQKNNVIDFVFLYLMQIN